MLLSNALGVWVQNTAVDGRPGGDEPVTADAVGVLADDAGRPTIAGETIKKGQNLTIMLGAVNRDPRRFNTPNQLLLDRDNPTGCRSAK